MGVINISIVSRSPLNYSSIIPVFLQYKTDMGWILNKNILQIQQGGSAHMACLILIRKRGVGGHQEKRGSELMFKCLKLHPHYVIKSQY